MNVSLRQLKAFLQVSRLKSFTRAAEQLHITQAGLSSLIRELEEQLGSRLFDRTTRAVLLTAAGVKFHAAAEQSISLLEGAATSIGRLEDSARQILNVGATPVIASSIMPEVCQMFTKQYPNVIVRIHDVERKKVLSMIESGQIDVGFGAFFKPAAGIERKPIFKCDLVLLAPHNMQIGEKLTDRLLPTIDWAELNNIPLLALATDNPIQQSVDSYLNQIGRANEPRQTFNNFETILKMVEAGFGAAILPSFAIAAARRLNIKAARVKNPSVPINYFQINLKGKARAVSENTFVECLIEVMKLRCDPKPQKQRKIKEY